MDKIHLKRLKRKGILEKRMCCHGNKSACYIAHPGSIIKGYKEKTAPVEPENRKRWWKRLFKNKTKV